MGFRCSAAPAPGVADGRWKSRSLSASTLGTATARNSPAINSRTSCSASRWSVLTRSDGPRGSPRRTDQTVHTRRRQPAGEREPSRPRLIRRTDQTRQPRHEFRDLRRPPRQPLPTQLPRIAVDHRRHRPADMHIQRHERLSLHHGRHPHECGPREATPRRSTRAPHARVPTLTIRPDKTPAAKDDRHTV